MDDESYFCFKDDITPGKVGFYKKSVTYLGLKDDITPGNGFSRNL